MRFDPPLVSGILLRRYKRFLADVRLEDGTEITAHCPNTGAMLGCDEPGSRVWLSRSDNPRRKYPHGWEVVEIPGGVRVGINTARTNALVDEALAADRLPELDGYAHRRREVRIGDSRLDFGLSHPHRRDCLLEVKNVTAAVDDGVALFPDAVSTRAARHADSLAALARRGLRAVLLFCVQRCDVDTVTPARAIDPGYAEALERALEAGIEVLAYRWRVAPEGIELDRPIGFSLA